MRRTLAVLTVGLALGLSGMALGVTPALQVLGPGMVTITRDSYGVPHIIERDQLSAAYATGYAVAQDRLWQMELFRRAGEGRLSEILGNGPATGGLSALQMDEVTRRDGYTTRELQAMYDALPLSLRAASDAFIDGINYYIVQALADPVNKMPAEFIGLGFVPGPWRGADLAAIAALGIRTFGACGGMEVDNAALYLKFRASLSPTRAQGVFNDFFWMVDSATPTTIPAGSGSFVFPAPASVQRFNPAQLAAIEKYAGAIEAAASTVVQENSLIANLSRKLGLPVHGVGESNAIAISGQLTQSGAPLLLGGPQTGLPIPTFWWEVGIKTTGYEGVGVIPPSGAGFVIGRTSNAAYSITSGEADVVDTYIDLLNPADPGQYQSSTVGGEPAYSEMDCRTETYIVKSVNLSGPAVTPPQLVTQRVCRIAHGPTAGRVECPVFYIDKAAGIALSRCFAVWKQELNSAADLVQLGSTANLSEFEAILPSIAANLNLTYADKRGNIAFFHNGLFPIRPVDTDPRFPLLGGGSQEWSGFLPASSNPQVVNPAQGWLANWNNSPALGWSSLEEREKWGAEHRVQGIMDIITRILSSGTKLTIDSLNEINFENAQKDVFGSRSVPFLQAAVAAVPTGDPDFTSLNHASTDIVNWLGKATNAKLFHVADQSSYTATVGGSDNGAPLIFPPLTVGGVDCPNFNCNYPDPGAELYELWRIQLQHDLFDGLLGGLNRQIGYDNVPGSEENDHANDDTKDAVLLHLLNGPSASVPPSCDYFNNCGPIDASYNQHRDQFLVNTLREVVHSLAAQGLSPDQAAHAVHTETFSSESAMPDLTVNAMNRGAFNMLVSLEPNPASFDVVPPGEAELINLLTSQQDLTQRSVTDPLHITDQLDLYANFKYKPMTIEATGPSMTEAVLIVPAVVP